LLALGSAVVGKDLWPMMQASGGQVRCDERVDEYRRGAAEVTLRTGCSLARIGTALDACDPESIYAADGTHLNDAGHGVIADFLAPMLEGLLSRARKRAG